MANLADELTAEQLAELENRIHSLYGDAYAQLKGEADEYFSQLNDRLQKAWESGEYTEEEFEAYKATQIARGQRWDALASKSAQRMADANQVASSMINDMTPSIYLLNGDFLGYQIENAYGVDWSIYNEQAVRNLVTGEGNTSEFLRSGDFEGLSRMRKVNTDPTADYAWNKELIDRAMASSIIRGTDLGDLTNEFLRVMGRNETAARRNARTASTSAMNAGRQDTMSRAHDMGINIKKQWLTCEDGRVRDSHAHLNSQIRAYDKPFSNGLMFPSDSSGRPEEVYNCRCSVVAVLPDYEDEVDRSDWEEWMAEKKKAIEESKQNAQEYVRDVV